MDNVYTTYFSSGAGHDLVQKHSGQDARDARIVSGFILQVSTSIKPVQLDLFHGPNNPSLMQSKMKWLVILMSKEQVGLMRRSDLFIENNIKVRIIYCLFLFSLQR